MFKKFLTNKVLAKKVMFCASIFSFSLALMSCSKNSQAQRSTDSKFAEVKDIDPNVKIIWTDYGVPHIEAKDWQSLGYGASYAVSQQNFCLLADQLLKVRSEKAKYLGPGVDNENIISDVVHLALEYVPNGKASFKKLSTRAQQLITGYAAGFNRYLAEKGAANLPRPCTGAEWVKPTSPEELMAYYLTLAERASGQVIGPAMLAAVPPSLAARASSQEFDFPTKAIPNFQELRLGSNAWALGKDKTVNGKGLLLGNPHFPAYGPLRFYQQRLRIPGVYDMQGVSLVGTPVVQIGFNEHSAWTHTVSKSKHFTLYQLELNPTNPLQYVFDSQLKNMTSKQFTISLKLPDGNVVPFTKELYFSHLGPLISFKPLEWSKSVAYAYRDANKNNYEFIDQWLDMGTSDNFEQFRNAFKKYRGVPWVNTLYADKHGNAFFIEGTPVPKMSAESIASWKKDFLAQAVYQANGVFLFKGNTSKNDWQGNLRGLTPYEEAPQLLRTDYVSNHNDSHWLTNVEEPLKGFSPLYGPEEYAQTYRTRMGLTMLMDEARDDGKFNLADLERIQYNDRTYLIENIRSELLQRCQEWSEAEIVSACDVLKNWDGRVDLESKGAQLMREFSSFWKPSYHRVKFDPKNPVNTPSGVVGPPIFFADPVKTALKNAIDNLAKAGIAMDQSLGEIQHFLVPNFEGGVSKKIPYSGGITAEGAFNVQGWDSDNLTQYQYPKAAEFINEKTGLTAEGYPINDGSSFMLTVEFTSTGPVARGLLSYSQSSNPDSPHFADQNELYSAKKFRDFPHEWNLVKAQYARSVQEISSKK